MKKEVKDIRYNVRMTKQTFDIVDSFEGNSFTSKFETLVEHSYIEKIPVKCGVLTEDQLFDMIGDHNELLGVLLDLTSKMYKNF